MTGELHGGPGSQQPQVATGESVPQGLHDPVGRSYDPLAQQATRSQAIQPYAPPRGQYGPPPTVHVTGERKSVGVAFVLTFFFGAFGMFYSTVTGALIMIAIAIGVTLVALGIAFLLTLATLGLGAFLLGLAPFAALTTWPVSIFWGCLAASTHNERLDAAAAQAAHRANYGPPPMH